MHARRFFNNRESLVSAVRVEIGERERMVERGRVWWREGERERGMEKEWWLCGTQSCPIILVCKMLPHLS